jgi:energy-converting hydrogenase Eha subunit H
MVKLMRAVVPVGAAVALAVAGAGTASADTNSNTQKSTQLLCNVVLLSPGAQVGEGCSSVQVSNQEMVKHKTSNASVVDYAAVKALIP